MSNILFILPVRGRPVKDVQATLKSVLSQTSVKDCTVISVQSHEAPAELVELARSRGVTLVTDTTPPEVWNIARCRNLALRAGAPTPFVWSIDVDVTVPDGAVERARELMEGGQVGLSPLVCDRGRTEATRIGSGISILQRSMVEYVCAWDESFEGYGSEDIDLFMRLGEKFDGAKVDAWHDGPVFEHRPHAPQEGKLMYGRQNLERLKMRSFGCLMEVDEQWGRGGRVVVRRGEVQDA